jgi:two-component system cell cycle response regulator
MSEAETIPRPGVLIVDDSRIVRTTIARLINADFEVHEAADGEAGWEAILGNESIVAVFSDLSMPKLDGFGLVQRIRASELPRVRNLPVIMLSGNEDDATKKRAREVGATDFISKSADGTEILTRVENLTRLTQAKRDLAVSREVLEQTATSDPLTGAFTPHYLITEGDKHFSHARRHGGPLSVVCFRIESYPEIAAKAGKDIADQILARIAKLVKATLRAEDSLGRVGELTFAVISTGISAPQAQSFARRLYDQLEKARINYNNEQLVIRSSIGITTLGPDAAESIKELIALAGRRMQQAAALEGERIVGQDEISVVSPPALPSDIERAVQALEAANADELAEVADEVLLRLLPFLQAAFKRVGIQLPVDKIAPALKHKRK